jgi:S1-C subfamily serine protease
VTGISRLIRTRCTALVLAGLAAASVAAAPPAVKRPPVPAAPAPPPAPGERPFAERVRSAVVSVRITGQDWNWKTPWAKQSPWTRTAYGLVVPGQRILIASPAIGNHLLLEAQKLGEDLRTTARLVLADYEGPLALLAVDDPAFWKDLSPLPLAERVPTGGEATVHRWLRSSQFESSTAMVRQVRAGRHGPSRVSLLTLDLSSSLDNAGDSEVVVADGEVVGLATQKSGETLSALASPVLRQFLREAQHEPYRGFARAGIAWQELTNPALRQSLGLSPDEGGVRITRVLPHGSGAGVLQEGDVVLEVGAVPLDVTGQFQHPVYGKLAFPLLITDGRGPGETLDFRILRNGERTTVAVPLKQMSPDEDRVPPFVLGRGPDYAVVGGLVFQELTGSYLATWGTDWARRAPPRLLIAYDRDGALPSAEQPRIVLLTSVLPDAANLGYQDLRDLIVTKVNGVPVASLGALREAFQRPQGDFHVVELLPGQGPGRLVLDAAEVRASTERIKTLYGVGP